MFYGLKKSLPLKTLSVAESQFLSAVQGGWVWWGGDFTPGWALMGVTSCITVALWDRAVPSGPALYDIL